MEHPGSAVNDFAKEATPENTMMSLSSQNCISDMPLPKSDEYFSSNVSNADTTVAYNILSMANKLDVDENGSGISNAHTSESNVILKLLSANIPESEPGESIVSGISLQQNESQMSAARSDVKEEYTAARVKGKKVITQELLESSTTSTGVNIPSEFRSSSNVESNLRRCTQKLNNSAGAGESRMHIIGSDHSKIEDKVFNCGKGVTESVLPEYLRVLLDGMDVCGDSGCPLDAKPEWFDVDKFRRGQRVGTKYLFGLILAEMLSLFMLLSFPGPRLSLIFTRKSHTPYKSFKRYLSTVTRVGSWYFDDIWQPGTKGHENIQVVRAMHQKARNKLHNTKLDEVYKKGTLSKNCTFGCKGAAIWSPLHEMIREDFQGSCPYPRPNQRPFLNCQRNPVFMNQMEMAITQFGFVGLFILFPSKFGAHGISDEDMNAFVYLWRCLGYILGTDDMYNFCNGDLETVRQRSRDVINFWVKPNLREVSRDWEHMIRCIVEGISFYIPAITFEISLLYLCSMLGIYAPRLRAALTLTQQVIYHLMNFVFLVLMRLPGVCFFFNWLLLLAVRKARRASPEVLDKLRVKQYPYEDEGNCTRL
ncbi:hypothetical protein Cfor_04164 [Coptotermes formosanus]|uniref:Uncharacterized protein n=1 Tax=Coptotermes formosanus TaxID=36987 RepID=A0A6L2PMJ6_COPFO|nr:hypothetical protein Cfor_04164 [Coptotermes formosanus]